MKTIMIIITFIFFIEFGISQTSSLFKTKVYTQSVIAEDPYNPNWDWENGDVSLDGIPHYWIYFQNRPNAIQEYAAIVPWYQTGASASLVDRKKEDGWVLLTRDFGTPARRLRNDKDNPYFVLYNANRSIIRVFILLENLSQLFNYSTMELKKYANGGKATGILAHLLPVSYAMDKVSNMYENATSSVINTLAMKARWVYADFPLAFDKNLIPTENTEIPASLEFQIFGTEVKDIVLETKGFGAQGDKKFIDAYMKKNNFDAPGFSLNGGSMPKLDIPFGLPNADIRSTAINWDGMKGFFNNLNIDLDLGNISASNPFKGLFGGFGATLSALSTSSPLSISGLDLGGMFKFFVGGGMKHQNVQQTPPTFISSHYSSTGTMTSKVPYAVLTIPIPASRLNFQSPMLGNAVGLVRNEPVGLLTLTKTPVIYEKYYFKYYDPFYNEYGLQDYGELANFTEYEIAEDIQVSLNQSSGLDIIKTEVSLVFDFWKSESHIVTSLNEFLGWVDSGLQNHLVEFEAPVNSTTARFKSMAVPIKFAKGRTIQIPPGYRNNIYLKLKSVLKRKDDPNAQPVVFISSYNVDIVNTTGPTEQILPTIPPQNVKCTIGSTGATITWDANPEKNIKHYVIERSINGGSYVQKGTSTTTSFVDAEVKKAIAPYTSTRYKNVSVNYRVKAYSSWFEQTTGITKSQYSAYCDVVNVYGSIFWTLWKQGLSQIVPETNYLSQNFPNPFNPSTTIYYGLKGPGNVTVKIFNTLGQEIITLVNEWKETGYHYVEWNAASLPSGVYFYKIQSEHFTESKKMILTK
ncbi:MAG: T9SS type A sorting domain-containing protein [Bacteroidota bacterium]|nr:T9SS type A sorting domain-containing protein [Bacteroidota bacterium]